MPLIIIRSILIITVIYILPIDIYAQNTVSGRVLSSEKEVALYGATVQLFNKADTIHTVDNRITDAGGCFIFNAVKSGNWILKYSCLGHIAFEQSFTVYPNITDTLKLPPVVLQEDLQWLDEVSIIAKQQTREIDGFKMFFSEEQKNKATTARELLLNIPGLYLNRISNSLAATDGKSLLVLINGIIATDQDLRMIPPEKIKNVEYYDVPPIRYSNSGKVMNIITKALDTGWAGDLYLNATGFFSEFTPYFSYVSGKQRFSAGYYMHLNNFLNNKKDEFDKYYEYHLGANDYLYNYFQKEHNWRAQHTVNFSYTNADIDKYTFQLKAIAGYATDHYDAAKNIELYVNNTTDKKEGRLQNSVKTFSPTLDLYYSRNIGEKSTLDANMLANWNNTRQAVYSVESGIHAFDDKMWSENRKITFIGEIVYGYKQQSHHLSFGYKTSFSKFKNTLTNSLVNEQKFTSELQKHYLYGEWKGGVGKWLYRISIGENIIIHQNDEHQENQWLFSPALITGFNLNSNHQLRLMYHSTAILPSSGDMSNNAVLIMNNMIKSGNPSLKSAASHDIQLIYNYSNKWADIGLNGYCTIQQNTIFNYYKEDTFEDQEVMILSAENALHDQTYGLETNLSLRPFKGLTLGVSTRAIYQVFQPADTISPYRGWFYPLTVFLNYQFKNFSVDYFQKFKSDFLEAMQIKGMEKVSYISLGYNYKSWTFAATYYFPWKNDFLNITIPQSLVYHKERGRLISKEHTLGLAISWNFNTASKRYQSKRILNNEEPESSVFKIR